jgi:hypothetical protein
MSIASLQKFTVPLAGGGQSASSQGLLMPKLKYRFRVSFENFGLGTAVTELTKQVVDFARPSVNFNPQTIEVYNSQVHYAGKPSWETTTVNIRDDALGNVSKLVGEQIQKQFDFLEQASAISGVDYKFITRCEITDGGNGTAAPAILETWELYGCFLSQVNYGEINYGSSDPVQIALTIQFDNAVQTPVDSGVGQAFARFALGSTVT